MLGAMPNAPVAAAERPWPGGWRSCSSVAWAWGSWSSTMPSRHPVLPFPLNAAALNASRSSPTGPWLKCSSRSPWIPVPASCWKPPGKVKTPPDTPNLDRTCRRASGSPPPARSSPQPRKRIDSRCTPTSLASTLPVVVAPEHTRDFTTWTEIIGDSSVLMGNPLHNSAAHAAARSAVAEVQNDTVSKQQLTQAVVSRTVSGDSGQPTTDEAELLENSVNQGRSVVVSEENFLDFAKTHPRGDEVRALVPDSGAWLLDYPLLVPSEAAHRNETIAQAADEIASFLTSESGREVLAEQSLRGKDGRRVPDSRSAPMSQRLSVEDELDWNRLMTTWGRQTSAHNALYVLDASDSMASENPPAHRSYWRTAVDSTVIRLQFIPTRDSIGLWRSAATDDSDRTSQELVPIRRMDEYVDGTPQRKELQDALARANYEEDVPSGLYATTLDAFREVKANYREGAVNSVVIISSGSSDRGTASELSSLVRTLKQEQDQDKPVHIVTMAITDGDPPQDLSEIAEATGGTSHSAATLQDIQERYLHTLSTY